MDKRIIKTRQSLQEALLALLHEEAFENIEIQAITDKADTARVTFYRHYGTKEELLLDVLESIYQKLQGEMIPLSIPRILDFSQPPPSILLFKFLENDRALHKKLLTGSVSALIQLRIRYYIVQQVISSLSHDPRYADLPISLLAQQMASILLGNILWWLAEDVPYSAEYMAKISHWTVIAGIMTIIGRGNELQLPPPDAWKIS